jgi:hypothetical protein
MAFEASASRMQATPISLKSRIADRSLGVHLDYIASRGVPVNNVSPFDTGNTEMGIERKESKL